MNCPKYIIKALNTRAKCAFKFTECDLIIAKFLDKHNIPVEDYDIHGGCESYVNPYNSSRRIYDAILEKE